MFCPYCNAAILDLPHLAGHCVACPQCANQFVMPVGVSVATQATQRHRRQSAGLVAAAIAFCFVGGLLVMVLIAARANSRRGGHVAPEWRITENYIRNQPGGLHRVVKVVVPAGSGERETRRYLSEVLKTVDSSIELRLNFYDGEPVGTDSMIANYFSKGGKSFFIWKGFEPGGKVYAE